MDMYVFIFSLLLLFVAYNISIHFWLYSILRANSSYTQLENDVIDHNDNSIEKYNINVFADGFTHNMRYSVVLKQDCIVIEQRINNIAWKLPIININNSRMISVPMLSGIIIWHNKKNIPSPIFLRVSDTSNISRTILLEKKS